MARAKQFESLIGTSESNLRFRAHYYIWDPLHGYLLFSPLNVGRYKQPVYSYIKVIRLLENNISQ